MMKDEKYFENFVGIGYSIIEKDQVIKQVLYGNANQSQNIPITKDTLFPIASISKIVTGLGILLLVQDNLLDLDTNINDYIEIKVVNPFNKDFKITSRILMQHLSGLNDPEHFNEVEHEEELSLKDYISTFLTEKGLLRRYWSEYKKPTYFYSNAGITLLGYIIEEVSKMKFTDFIQKRIFDPLEIKNAGWNLFKLNKDFLTRNYDIFKKEIPLYQVKEYPACQLRISITDLNKILMIFTANDEKIIKNDILQLMFPNDCEFGLIWWGSSTWYGKKGLWSHGGHMKGVRTMMGFYPKIKSGFIILTNGEIEYSELDVELRNFLQKN